MFLNALRNDGTQYGVVQASNDKFQTTFPSFFERHALDQFTSTLGHLYGCLIGNPGQVLRAWSDVRVFGEVTWHILDKFAPVCVKLTRDQNSAKV
jgi:hypothetical protein